jgi:hypothetical protein
MMTKKEIKTLLEIGHPKHLDQHKPFIENQLKIASQAPLAKPEEPLNEYQKRWNEFYEASDFLKKIGYKW